MYENVACSKESQGKSLIVYTAVGYPKANGTVALQQTLRAGAFTHICKSREPTVPFTQIPDVPHVFILPHTKPSEGQEGI